MRAIFLALFCLSTGLACKRAQAGPCAFDLGGVWINASDERYGYRLEDQGSQVTGEFFLRQPSGAATPRAPGEAAVTLALRRDGSALAGTMRSTALTAAGKSCEVEFTVKVGTCTPEQLQVTSEMTAPLDEQCRRIQNLPDGGPVARDLAEFLWVRPGK